MKKANRNEPCPCGSRRKYKNCHGKRPNQTAATIAIGLVVLIGGGLLMNYYSTTPTSGPRGNVQAPGQSIPQPEGEAPQGKVWSAEHGHWHDAPEGITAEQDPAQAASEAAPSVETPVQQTGGIPQPEGPVPAGKVWSPEHGHWHDVAESTPPAGPPYPQPEGPVPEGKIWSADHGHWHDFTPPAADSSKE